MVILHVHCDFGDPLRMVFLLKDYSKINLVFEINVIFVIKNFLLAF